MMPGAIFGLPLHSSHLSFQSFLWYNFILQKLVLFGGELPTMSWIMKIMFGRSRSSSYSDIVKMAQSLPNYSENDGIIECGAKTIREYIIHHAALEGLMQAVEKWKSSQIYLYEVEYKQLNDFWRFRERVTAESGKYAPILKSGTVGMNSITMEDLPYPIVHYPSHYGAFFAFSEDIDTEMCFCECERTAIENYIELRQRMPLLDYSGSKTYPLGADYFSEAVAEKSRKNSRNPLALFRFEKGLCFRCNHKIPRLEYCLDMYAGNSKFKQTYGWYINQEYFRCGIDPYQHDNILEDKCPPEILDYSLRCNRLREQLEADPENADLQDELSMYNREFHNSIENRARESLGFKKIGETWVSETILFNIVKGIYPTAKVIKHHRPKWLQGLELDIFLPEYNLAFEYQGIQHFVAVEHWGGEAQLKKQQAHDALKKQICKEKGVSLICINYDDSLTEDFVKAQIRIQS